MAIHSKERVYTVDSGASLHMRDYLLWKKTIRQSSKSLDFQTANGIVVSDAQAKVYIKERGANVWVRVVEDSPSVLSLGRPCNELGHHYSWPSGETPRFSKGKKVIGRSIEHFVPVVAVTAQKAETSIDLSSAKGNFERGMLAKKKTLDDKKNFPRLSPMRGEILWRKIPRVRKESSVPNQEETTMCSLIFRKIPIVKSVRRPKQHEPGVG